MLQNTLMVAKYNHTLNRDSFTTTDQTDFITDTFDRDCAEYFMSLKRINGMVDFHVVVTYKKQTISAKVQVADRKSIAFRTFLNR